MAHVKLIGSATALPKHKVKFEDINGYLGTFERANPKVKQWVSRIQPVMKEMLGIDYCHYAYNAATKTVEEDNLSLSIASAQRAIEKANIPKEAIDLIVYGGGYSHQLPPISAQIQDALGIGLSAEIQVHANCTSAYKAIKIAHNFLKSGEFKTALVLSSNVISPCFLPEYYNQEILDKEDIFLRWYLCDGAGAWILQAKDATQKREEGLYLTHTYIESAGHEKQSAMGNKYNYYPTSPLNVFQNGAHHMKQLYINVLAETAMEANGKSIFFNALNRMLEKQSIPLEKLAAFSVNMPSKAVRDLVAEECEEIGIAKDLHFHIMKDCGYVGPPAALISIDHLMAQRTFEDGDIILSFVMEVSKFMQAGFVFEYVGRNNE